MTTKEKMNSSKKTARIVGVLFITATVASSLSIVILSPILDAPDYLISVSANEYQVIMAALFMLIDVVQLLASQL
jgi:type IV secretory pathway component VirB8